MGYIRPKIGAKVKQWSCDERKWYKGIVLEKNEKPRGMWGGFRGYLYKVKFENGEIKELKSSDLDYDK